MTMVKTKSRRALRGGNQGGCGIRVDAATGGGDCLALGVSWREGEFRVQWSLTGTVAPGANNRDFADRLRGRIGHRPLWVPVTDRKAEQNLAIHAVDLDARDEQGRLIAKGAKRKIFVRTQVGKHVPEATRDDRTFADTRQLGTGRSHTIGAIVRHDAVNRAYTFWRHDMKLRSPHVGAAAIGLANTAVALLPELTGPAATHQLIVLETLHATYGCFFQGARLLCTLFYEPAANHRLHPDMLVYWRNKMREDFAVDEATPIETRVVQSWPLEQAPPGIAAEIIWNPWESTRLKWLDAGAKSTVLENPDIAPVAFGLALQGV